MSDIESYGYCTPPEISKTAQRITDNLLPAKSKDLYQNTYLTFETWREKKGTNRTSESVLMTYFDELSKSYAPNTLWSIYSKLKTTIRNTENVDISNYQKVISMLKINQVGYKPKKSRVFTSENITNFLNEAPDNEFLAVKVVMIFGITGACRKDELTNIKMSDIEREGKILLVRIPFTKTNVARSFTMEGEFCDIVKKYAALRPQNCRIDRFFLKYSNGKCANQPIGKNTFGTMPQRIAEYLKLAEPALYTGHSFRRSSATLLANAGGDMDMIKRHGGWKSSNVAEGYVEESTGNKRKICNLLTSDIALASTSTKECNNADKQSATKKLMLSQNVSIVRSSSKKSGSLQLSHGSRTPMINIQNCSVNIYYTK